MVTQIVDGAEERALVFIMLKDLFSAEPDEKNVRRWLADDIFGLFPQDAAVMPGRLKEALIAANPGELMRDYSELFVINSPHNVYQWESAHRNGERVMMGRSVLSVLAFYKRYGLKAAEREVPDSLACELEFLYRTSLDIRALEDGNKRGWILKDQKSFYERHLNIWVPGFAGLLKRHAGTDFYRLLADLLVATLSADYKKLCSYS